MPKMGPSDQFEKREADDEEGELRREMEERIVRLGSSGAAVDALAAWERLKMQMYKLERSPGAFDEGSEAFKKVQECQDKINQAGEAFYDLVPEAQGMDTEEINRIIGSAQFRENIPHRVKRADDAARILEAHERESKLEKVRRSLESVEGNRQGRELPDQYEAAHAERTANVARIEASIAEMSLLQRMITQRSQYLSLRDDLKFERKELLQLDKWIAERSGKKGH